MQFNPVIISHIDRNAGPFPGAGYYQPLWMGHGNVYTCNPFANLHTTVLRNNTNFKFA